MAEWTSPKVDWKINDYFNATDYNRIINNIAFLNAFLGTLFNGIGKLSMGEEKSVRSAIYAQEINDIENAIENLNLKTYNFNIGNKKEYADNGKTPNYEEFNRIESAMLKLYEQMLNHKENLARLEVRLGNLKGIRV